MKLKKLTSTIFISLFLCIFFGFYNSFSMDGSDAEILDTFDPAETDPEQGRAMFQQNSCDAVEALGVLLDSRLNLLNLLQQNIYLHTNPVNVRPILDLPALYPYFFYNDCYNFTTQIFYNQTRLNFFTKDCPFISSYLALGDQELSDLIKDTVGFLNDSQDANLPNDIPEILTLFQNIKLEQRRTGIMFGFAKQTNNIFFSLRTPFYYLENNFFLNNNEINSIKDEPFFRRDGIAPEADQSESEAFFKKHLVSDRIGWGDTRINLEYHWFHAYGTDSWLGILATVPTAGDFKRGLIGGIFDNSCQDPKFDFLSLYCFINENQNDRKALEETTNFLIPALDRLTAIVADQPLGNGRSFGIGPKFDLANYINYNWTFYTTCAFEFFSTQSSHRYFLATKNAEEFNRLENIDVNNIDDLTEAQAEEVIDFLNQQMQNIFYPKRVLACVRPGWQFKFRQMLMLDSDKWHASLGWDFWRQAADKLTIPGRQSLEYEKGLSFSARQIKLFTNIGYYSLYEEASWYVMVNVDGTVDNRGIGKDFTLGVRLGFEF